MSAKTPYTVFRQLLLSLLVLTLAACATRNADISDSRPPAPVSQSSLGRSVHYLSVKIGPRNLKHYDGLQRAAKYIHQEFTNLGYKVERQQYQVEAKAVENLIIGIGPKDAPRIIIGAHYDSFGDQPGADDNASGVAGLIALAKLLKLSENKLDKRIELVAYTLEEPPYFRTQLMGSYQHAKRLHNNKVKVIGMIALEMIGYFSDEEDSQNYPIGLMGMFYPDVGNFIGVVSNFSSSSLKNRLAEQIKKADIDVQTLMAPAILTGVDFSDHMNYWEFGYDAVMITDTAFYRNHHYHKHSDVISTLNLEKMAAVVRGVYYGVLDLAIEKEPEGAESMR
ncbi:MAG: M28 family peptidase [Gammaproteobacteria bacterium]|nr:M28 family peptidase [Gammaproteobacteria bacterium]MDH5652566.1 M28 family peptidase [Gammaproteobacteria bacterium]